MSQPRWRKVLRDLTFNKTRSFLVVLSISLGVFAVGVISNSQRVLTNDAADRFAATHPYSAALATTEPFDEDLVKSVDRMKGIAAAEGRSTTQARIRKVGSDEWFQLSLNALEDYAHIRINRIWPEAGEMPPSDREILLEYSSFLSMGARIGDVAEIEMPSGRKRQLRMAGAVRDLSVIPPVYTSLYTGYITMDTLEWLGEPRGFNRLFITVSDNARDRGHIEEIAAQVRDNRLEAASRKVTLIDIPLNPGEPPLGFVIQAILMILGVLSLLVLLPSGFLVVNTISALLTHQVRQVGIMKAIGARTSQIAGMYLSVVILFGLLALVIPLPLAVLGARAFCSYMAGILNIQLATFSFPAETLILQGLVALGVPLLAALCPIIAGTRITVREAISRYGLENGDFGSSGVDRMVERLRGLPRPLLLSLRNAVRSKGRLALTLTPLILGGALFISVFGVRASLLRSLDELAQFWKYDVAVDLHAAYPVERLRQQAMSVPGVVGAEMWQTASATVQRADGSESIAFPVIGLPASTRLVQPTIVQGRWLLPEDENAVVISTTLLRYEPGMQLGDAVLLKIGDRKSTWHVVGLVQGGMTTIPNVYANYEYLARVTRNPNRANSLRITTAQHDAPFQLETMSAIEERFKRDGVRVSFTESSAELVERITSGMMVLVIFLLVLAILLAAVGALGLMGTMSLNVLERTREMGVMRAIGASNRAILQIVMVESVWVAILSGLAAAVLSYPISWGLSYETGELLFKTPLSFAFAPGGVALWLALVVMAAAAASYLPARNATRVTVHEVLAYE